MLDWKNGAHGRKFVVSFSGGKDSVLALYHSMKVGEATGLIVVMDEDGKRSRSHGISEELIRAQADAIGLPVYAASASWADYEKVFVRLLENAKQHGAEVLVTGDLDVPAHDCWHDKVAGRVGLRLGMPLWERDHFEVVKEFVNLGFTAILVTVNLSMGMQEEDLGRVITHDFLEELADRGIDPCGESGEFHTMVIDGPIFKQSVPVLKRKTVRDGDYAFLPLELP
jgi:uncharacterized protein (TIGR00290 family)